MNEVLRNLRIGQVVKVKIANVMKWEKLLGLKRTQY